MKSIIFFGILCSFYIICGLWISSDSAVVIPQKRLKCEYYDPKDCDLKENCIPEVREKDCEDSDPDKPSHCFVVWKTDNVTGVTNITMKGCFTDNIACDQTECVDNTAELKKNLNFCCCRETMCNKAHKWIPTTTKATEIEAPPPEEIISEFMAVVIAVPICLLIFAGIIVYYILKRNKRGMFNEVPTSEPEMTNSSPCLALRPIQLIEMKARGRFGAVWKATMKPDEVAVKIFPVQDKDSWASEHEIYKLARMKHPNILEFIGAEKHTEHIQAEFWLITAYHNNGSLCDYLKAYTVTWTELCRISESMARGLMHLHEEIGASKMDALKPAIAHRDFKSKNVLLKNDLTACIADFGLALVFNPGKSCGDTHGQVGTRRYMAPEVLEGAINFTRDAFLRIDVYACGLVLWELVSRCTVPNVIVPQYALPFESELGLHPSLEEMQENVVMKKLRPKIEDNWKKHSGLNAICDTIEECWDHDAEARLSSSCVMERIAQHTRYPITHLLIETNTTDTSTIKDSTDHSM